MRRAFLALVVLALAVGAALGWSGSALAISTATTSTTLAISPSSIALDGSYTLTATVTGATVPQGSVRFWSGSDLLATAPLTPVSGSTTTATASVTLANWFAAGVYPLTASYASPDILTWGQSTSPPVNLTVAGVVVHNSTTTLSVSPTTITQGDPVTLTAVVTRDDGVLPTGTVTFRDGGTLVGTAQIVGTASVVNGVATLTRSDFLAGVHNFTASYVGPTNDVASSYGSATLTVNAPSTPTAVATTTTLVTLPGTVREGDTVTLRAHVVQSGGTASPPGGPIVTFRDITSAPATYLGEAPLGADGYAQIDVSGWTAGTYEIRAEYFGDVLDQPSNGRITMTVLPSSAPVTVDTALVAAPATATATTAPTLSATLTAGGSPVAGELVTLAAASSSCTATTGTNGVASCTLPAAVAAGTYTVTATYDGSSTYNASSTTSSLVVTKTATTLTVPSLTVVSGGPATLSATLKAGSTPLSGKTVTLTAGTQSCTATTTATGVASCAITFNQKPGSYTLGASFAGDATYAASTGTGVLTATGKATRLYVLPSFGVYHHTTLLSAVLVDANGLPVAGKTVKLTVGANSCTNETNAWGIAVCTITVDTAPGTATITGTFAGAVGYVESADTSTIVIAKQQTTLKVTSVTYPAYGKTTVTVKLVDDLGAPIAGAPVTITVGTTTVTATTNSSGVASATISSRSTSISARYAGNAYYAPDTTSDCD